MPNFAWLATTVAIVQDPDPFVTFLIYTSEVGGVGLGFQVLAWDFGC